MPDRFDRPSAPDRPSSLLHSLALALGPALLIGFFAWVALAPVHSNRTRGRANDSATLGVPAHTHTDPRVNKLEARVAALEKQVATNTKDLALAAREFGIFQWYIFRRSTRFNALDELDVLAVAIGTHARTNEWRVATYIAAMEETFAVLIARASPVRCDADAVRRIAAAARKNLGKLDRGRVVVWSDTAPFVPKDPTLAAAFRQAVDHLKAQIRNRNRRETFALLENVATVVFGARGKAGVGTLRRLLEEMNYLQPDAR